MPGSFKIRARSTDAVTVSETVVNETTNELILDGEAPRLGTSSAPMLPNVPPASAFSNVDSGPTLPVSAPTPLAPPSESGVEASSEPRHPMAHLMPEKAGPSEASRRAAEARAAKAKKAKKVKIIVWSCVLVVTVVVGPPLAKWTINAINEAGNMKTDEPVEAPAGQPAVDTGSDPQATPSAGQQAIDDAKQLVANTTPPVAP